MGCIWCDNNGEAFVIAAAEAAREAHFRVLPRQITAKLRLPPRASVTDILQAIQELQDRPNGDQWREELSRVRTKLEDENFALRVSRQNERSVAELKQSQFQKDLQAAKYSGEVELLRARREIQVLQQQLMQQTAENQQREEDFRRLQADHAKAVQRVVELEKNMTPVIKISADSRSLWEKITERSVTFEKNEVPETPVPEHLAELHWYRSWLGSRLAAGEVVPHGQSWARGMLPLSTTIRWRSVLYPGVNLEDAYLPGVDFTGGATWKANFAGAMLKAAVFKETTLSNVNFARANLRGANFKHAWLDRGNFNGAKLEGADFEGAYLGGASFEQADFGVVPLQLHGLLSNKPQAVATWKAHLKSGVFDGKNSAPSIINRFPKIEKELNIFLGAIPRKTSSDQAMHPFAEILLQWLDNC